MWPLVALTVAVLTCPEPVAAACRIALALAIDVSRSINAADYEIQRNGLIAALADPQVQSAFLVPQDHVSLAVYEWGGRDYQDLVVDWIEIRSAADLATVSGLIAAQQQISQYQATALGWALDYGHQLFDSAPACDRQVLDVSGDGRNNDGKTPETVFAALDFAAIVVNGLAIGQHESDLTRYYQTELIRGPGAFVERAAKQADFPATIRRKLLRELSDQIAAVAGPSLPDGG